MISRFWIHVCSMKDRYVDLILYICLVISTREAFLKYYSLYLLMFCKRLFFVLCNVLAT